VVSEREAGGTTVRHENADEVCRSRGVVPPFSQRQFLFRFIPLRFARISMLIIFISSIRLLKLPACILERSTHRSICHLGRLRDENRWRREREQKCSVGRPEERRRGYK